MATTTEREAEWALIGALLVDPDRLQDPGVAILAADDLADTAAREVFGVIVRLVESEAPVDVISVAQEMRTGGHLEALGGLPWLMDLVAGVPTAAHIGHYADLVRDHALQRRLRVALEHALTRLEAAEDGHTALTDLQAWLATVADAEQVARLLPVNPQPPVVADAHEALQRAMDPRARPIYTPWRSLDAIGGGIRRGDLLVLAARTSVGKSTMAVQIAGHAAQTGHPTLYVSYEVSPDRLVIQLATQRTGRDRYRLLQGRDPHPEIVGRALDAMRDWPMWWWRGGERPTWPAVATRIGQLAHQHGIELVVIDHLELIPLDRRAREHVTVELGQLTAEMKAAAVRYHVAMIAVDQLNRQADTQQQPTLSNLGWSSGIEKSADSVWALDRVDREDPDSDRWVYVLKHREGSLGKVQLRWDPGPTRLVDPTEGAS